MTNVIKAVGLLYEKDNKVLCVSRRYDHTKFGLIGGKIDPGENEKMALVREVKEESNIDLDIDLLEDHFTDIDEHGTVFKVFKYNDDINVVEGIHEKDGGVVKWLSWYGLMNGAYPEYNTKLYNYTKIKEGLLFLCNSHPNDYLPYEISFDKQKSENIIKIILDNLNFLHPPFVGVSEYNNIDLEWESDRRDYNVYIQIDTETSNAEIDIFYDDDDDKDETKPFNINSTSDWNKLNELLCVEKTK